MTGRPPSYAQEPREAIEAEVAKLKAWRAGYKASGRSIEAASCSIGVAALRSLQRRLGLAVPPHREDFGNG